MMNDLIREANYARDMQKTASPYLACRRTECFFAGYDGKPLFAVCYRADAPRAAVVISHGFTESCERYDELAYYLLKNGYTVFIPEHRGHGQSYREVNSLTLTHIDRFSEYVDDFEAYIDTVVRKEWDGPLHLFAHSMGGAIAVLYMLRHPTAIQKAVLNAPMIGVSTGPLPIPLARAICRLFMLIGKGAERSFTSSEYTGKEPFETSCSSSAARYEYYAQKKRSTDYLQNHSPTYNWIYESLGVTRAIFRPQGLEHIATRVLLFSSPNDNMVRQEPQRALVARLPHAEFQLIENSKHEIFSSADEVLLPYLQRLICFLG